MALTKSLETTNDIARDYLDRQATIKGFKAFKRDKLYYKYAISQTRS